jgi:ribonuclease PH
MLKTRLELHNEVYNSRLKREQKAKQRAGLIKRYIGTLHEPAVFLLKFARCVLAVLKRCVLLAT